MKEIGSRGSYSCHQKQKHGLAHSRSKNHSQSEHNKFNSVSISAKWQDKRPYRALALNARSALLPCNSEFVFGSLKDWPCT